MSSSDGLRPEDWEKIEKIGEKQTLEPGKLLFEPGEPSDHVMWVIEGDVEACGTIPECASDADCTAQPSSG